MTILLFVLVDIFSFDFPIQLNELSYPTNPEDSIPPVVFEPEDSEAMRNLRDLYILQQIFHYLYILVQQDLPRLRETHAPIEEPAHPTSVQPPTVRIPDITDLYRGLVMETTTTHHFHREVYLQYVSQFRLDFTRPLVSPFIQNRLVSQNSRNFKIF